MHAFCSHCGKPVLQDEYNLKKHGKTCDFAKDDIFEILKENSYGYDLRKKAEDTLELSVYEPHMNLRPGFKDRYQNGSWHPVFHACFKWNSKMVEECGKYSLPTWMFLIAKKEVRYIGKIPGEEIIASVFPVIPFIYSLSMFYHIYENKGYQVIDYQPSKEIKERYCIPVKEEQHKCLIGTTAVFGNLIKEDETTVLAARIYFYDQKTEKYEFHSFIIGEHLLWMSDEIKNRSQFCRSIWKNNIDNFISEEVLDEFDKNCPSFGLGNYRKGSGRNILIPLLASGNYHKGLELLVKSGNSWYADCFFERDKVQKSQLFDVEPSPWSYQTVSKFLTLPKAVLKQVHDGVFINQEARKRIAYIYEEKRSMLEGISFNENNVHFLMTQNITHDASVDRSLIHGLEGLTDQEIRKILKYLWKLSEDDYEIYRDYLQMKFVTGINDFGYCPRDVQQAHDNLLRSLWSKKQIANEHDFGIAVEKYKNLETSNPENEHDKNKEKFFIRCPHNLIDLQREGRNQHNCVAGYESWIINGRSKVLFMRKYSEPEKSLVTIELQGKRLIQAKAAYNHIADTECQKFICKWCTSHGIQFASCRDITVKVS